LYLAILDPKVKFKVEDPHLTRIFTIFDSMEFAWDELYKNPISTYKVKIF